MCNGHVKKERKTKKKVCKLDVDLAKMPEAEHYEILKVSITLLYSDSSFFSSSIRDLRSLRRLLSSFFFLIFILILILETDNNSRNAGRKIRHAN